MKPGDMIRLIGEFEDEYDYMVLWNELPDFTSIYMKNHTGKFHYTRTGIILEQKAILDGPLHVRTTWSKVLCSDGICWIKSCELELVQSPEQCDKVVP